MNILTKIAAPALAATLAIAVAAPASAAPRFENGQALRSEIAQLDRQVDRALYRHQIDRREARLLERKVDRLQHTWRSYARGGFTRAELRQLDKQVDTVKWQLAKEIREGHRDRYERREHDTKRTARR